MEGKVLCSLFLLLVNYLSSTLSEDNVPVLLWESKSTGEQFRPVPALAEYDRDEFLNHFLKKIKATNAKPLVVVFLEGTLSLEDFSWQDSSKQQAFSNVKHLVDHANGIEFLPAVKSAEEAIQKLKEYGYSHKDLKDLQDNEMGIISVVRLDEAKSGEDRPDLLNRHDVLINEIVKKLHESQSNFISVLTGEEASWIEPEISRSRVRRALAAADMNETNLENGYVFNASGKVLLQTKDAPVLTVDGETVVLPPRHTDTLDAPKSGSEDTVMRIISKFEPAGGKKIFLRFKFELSSGYWTLTQVQYTYDIKEGVLYPTKPIRAERGFSYLNPSPYEFYSENKTSSLRFLNLKAQAWTSSGTFDQAESKVGFFTIPIWTGIFVVGMMALIMVWGLIMVLDIKTMDQFDDPKGKTISINASE